MGLQGVSWRGAGRELEGCRAWKIKEGRRAHRLHMLYHRGTIQGGELTVCTC